MGILYVKLFQPYAQYRNPYTFNFAQTYPLPPKSTIVGMLQNATGDYYSEVYNGLRMAILADSSPLVFWHYQHFVKGTPTLTVESGKATLYGKEDKLPLYHSEKRHQRSPRPQQELFNVNLHLFLQGDDSLLERVEASLKKPRKILYLGRSEDIIFIRAVGRATVKNKRKIRDKRFEHPFYAEWGVLHNSLDSANRFPAYSLPIKSEFLIKDRKITSFQEILHKKGETLRKTEFAPVYFVEPYSVPRFREPVTVETIKAGGSEFSILKDGGWL
ncbi:MAG: type I-B CRISPR-associated protein Cas5b [Nitrospirota bacterium]